MINIEGSIPYELKQNKYVFDFGNVKKDSQVLLTVDITGKDITGCKVQSTCGCTVAAPTRTKDGYSVRIEYKNSNIKAPFSKTVKSTVTQGGATSDFLFNIKGIVI